jgi:hypothetical protein
MGMASSQSREMVQVSLRQGNDVCRFRDSVPWNSLSGTVSLARVAGNPVRVQVKNAATQHTRRGNFVLSGRGRGQQKRGPSDLVGGPVRVCARRELVPMIRELLPKNRNWEEWIPVQVRRGRAFARRRREWTTT